MKVASTDYKVTPLRKVMTMCTPEHLSEIISSFSCEMDKDVELFLREKAIVQEKKHISRTYLIFTADPLTQGSELAAYFTITISSMDVAGLECSNESRKKMDVNNLAQSYLIGQIGKRDGSQKGLGRSAMLCATELIKSANLKAGCRVIRLDRKPFLVKYYAENGFLTAGRSKDGNLHQMVCIINSEAAVSH
jgi:hypothetical protein